MADDFAVVALFHALKWSAGSRPIELAQGIRLAPSAGSLIERHYPAIAERYQFDDDDLHDYPCFARFDANVGDVSSLDLADPFYPVARLSNLIVVLSAFPVTFCRVIWSYDRFASTAGTTLLYTMGSQTEFLMGDYERWPTVTPEWAAALATAWQTQEGCLRRRKAESRIVTALLYFFYAWRAFYLEHVCLHLAMALEVLFAPHSQSEISHQVSFNVARYAADGPEEQEKVYQLVRKLYAQRSAIVHGGVPSQDRVIDSVVDAFPFVSSVLRTIVGSPSKAEEFDDEAARRLMLKRLLFSV